MAEAVHALAAGLGVTHRATDGAGEPWQQLVLRIGSRLRAEASTDVGGDHPDLRGIEPVPLAQLVPDRVRTLAGLPMGQPAIGIPPARGDACLHRRRRQPLIDDVGGDHDLATVEVDLTPRQADTDVGASAREQQHVVGQALGDTHRARQDVVVDDHHLRRVGGLGAGLRDHCNDRLTDVANSVGGQCGAGEGRREERDIERERPEVDFGGGVDAEYSRRLQRLGDVDPCKHRVCHLRAHVDHMRCSIDVEVVDERSVPRQQRRILGPHHSFADQPHRVILLDRSYPDRSPVAGRRAMQLLPRMA